MLDQQAYAEELGFTDMGEALRCLHREWSQEAIADLIGVSRMTISNWMRQWDIPPRERGCSNRGRNEKYQTSLKRLGPEYIQKKTAAEVAQRLGCARKTVSHYVALWGWKTRGHESNFSIAI